MGLGLHPRLLLFLLLRRPRDAQGARRTISIQPQNLALRAKMRLSPHPLLLLLRNPRDALGANRKRPANNQSNLFCPCLLP
jgi:hypothetical protein